MSLRKANAERVTIVKFRLNKRDGNSYSSETVDEKSDTTKAANVMKSRLREGRNLISEDKVMVER